MKEKGSLSEWNKLGEKLFLKPGQNFYDQDLFRKAFKIDAENHLITPPEVHHAFTNLCQSMSRERTDHGARQYMRSLIAHRANHLRQFFPMETRNDLRYKTIRIVMSSITNALEEHPRWWQYVNHWVNSISYEPDGTHNPESKTVAPLYHTWLYENLRREREQEDKNSKP